MQKGACLASSLVALILQNDVLGDVITIFVLSLEIFRIMPFLLCFLIVLTLFSFLFVLSSTKKEYTRNSSGKKSTENQASSLLTGSEHKGG